MSLREKDPVLFRDAMMKFLSENPQKTIYDKPITKDLFKGQDVQTTITKTQTISQEAATQDFASTNVVQSYILNDFDNSEFKNLLWQYREGNSRALDRIVKGNMKLVASIAESYVNLGVDYEDLVQEGAIGLVKALDRFDADRNVPFPAYAKWWIYQHLSQALITMQSAVGVSNRQASLHKKIRKCVERYEQEHGYEPSPTEIDIDEDIEPEDIAFFISLPESLQDLTISCDNWDEYPSTDDDTDCLLEKESQKVFVNTLLLQLKERDAFIVRLLYGIGEKSETMSEIGSRLNISRERVRQIAEKSIRHLKDIIGIKREEAVIGDYIRIDLSGCIGKIVQMQKTRDGSTMLVIEMDNGSTEKVVANKSSYTILKKPKNNKLPRNYISTKFRPGEKELLEYGKTVQHNPEKQHEVFAIDGVKVGDHIVYDHKDCKICRIIVRDRTSRFLIKYPNDVQHYVINDKSRYRVVSPPKSSRDKSLAKKTSFQKTIERNRKSCEEHFEPKFLQSTSLNELVKLKIITKKQLNHCHKKKLRTIGDVKLIIEKYHLTPDSTRFSKYSLDMWFAIVSLLKQ